MPALLDGVRVDRAVADADRDLPGGGRRRWWPRGGCQVDGVVVDHPEPAPAGGDGPARSTSRPSPTRRSMADPEVVFDVVYEDDEPGGGGQAGRPGRAPRRRPTRGHPGLGPAGPLPRPGRRWPATSATRTARASSTGSTGAPRGCWSWPAPRPPTGRWSPSWRRARSSALPGAGGRPRRRGPGGGGGADRPVRPHAHPHGRLGPGPGGPDRLPGARAATTDRRPSTPAGAGARDRADPPDPGAPGGHRPPGGRRRPLRPAPDGRSAVRAWLLPAGSAVPARRRARLRPPGDRRAGALDVAAAGRPGRRWPTRRAPGR